MSEARFGWQPGDVEVIDHLPDHESLYPITDKAFDPDQPRDEHGRWTDSGGTPVDRATRLASSEFRHGQGILLTQREKFQTLAQHLDLYAGSIGANNGIAGLTWDELAREAKDDPQSLRDYLRDVTGISGDDARMLTSGILWKNGNALVLMTDPRYAKEGLSQVESQIDKMMESGKYPPRGLVVHFGYQLPPDAREKNTLACASGNQIWIKASTASDFATADPKGMGERGHFMPEAQSFSLPEYVLAHEFGHVMENEARFQSYVEGKKDAYAAHVWLSTKVFAAEDLPVSESDRAAASSYKAELSLYGRSSVSEAAAEIYASWYLSGGKSPLSVVQEYARRAGWKAP